MSHNIAIKTKEEQEAIQHDLLTALWAHKVQKGLMSQPQIIKTIQEYQDPELRQHLMSRFEYYKAL